MHPTLSVLTPQRIATEAFTDATAAVARLDEKSSSVMHHNNWRDPSDTARLAALKRYLKAKPARPAEDYRAILLVPRALAAFGVTIDCLRGRLTC